MCSAAQSGSPAVRVAFADRMARQRSHARGGTAHAVDAGRMSRLRACSLEHLVRYCINRTTVLHREHIQRITTYRCRARGRMMR